ncbi:MAG TPA: serpin family protein, partial [Candidatus Limnocylindrales bacterium]|nr:serpin family protein [Candidatus Limnocylindrales bacterium]
DYGAGLQAVDFAGNLDASRVAINRWVAARTSDRIRELLGPDSINNLTRFVLVNAIFFKASWASPFEPAQTTSATFHRLDGTTLNVPTMHGSFEGSYVRGEGWRAIEIPYVGATMTVILPDAGRFAAVEQALDSDFLAALATRRSFDLVHLAMPRWSSTTSVDLVTTLRQLGVTDLFDPGAADLSGIAAADLHVSQVIHQATIDVDEHGTEAAAATAIAGGTTGGGPVTEVTVTVDRPFFYLIRDGDSGEILFTGRVLDPAAH